MNTANNFSTTWNLTPLFTGNHDPQIKKQRQVLKKQASSFVKKWQSRRDYLKDPQVLKTALDDYEFWLRQYGSDGHEGFYFWLRTQQDQNDPQLKAKFNSIVDFATKIENQLQFFPLRLARISKTRRSKFLSHPKLAKYRHFLEHLFAQSKYLLSEPEEKILNLKATTSHLNWVKMTSSFLAKEERQTLTEDQKKQPQNFSQLTSLMNSQNKQVRDQAAQSFNHILSKYIEVGEAELNSILANKKTDDELRKMDRPDLARHLSDDIDTQIVDTLIQAVSQRFNISQRYYQLKSQLFKTRKLAYHERNVPYGDFNQNYPFNKAIELVLKVFHNLDPQFAHIVKSFLKNGQIDAFPQKGKTHGAFCASGLLIHPTYVLLNHTNKLQDVLTLAHELGHAINDELIKKTQHALNFGVWLSTAETASTFMEDFVLQELLQRASAEEQLALMMMKLDEDISPIFRQITFYRFEQDLHQAFRSKHYLSHQQIGRLFSKHMQSYMGDFVNQSPGSQNWWLYVDHFRRFFYVYSYASGLLISKFLQASVHQHPTFITKVKAFLSAGTSNSPQNLFAKLGIDITDKKFWHQGLDEVEKLLTDTQALARKLGKIN